MKSKLLFAALLVSAASPTLAQVPGSVANVIFNFTLSFSKEGTVLKDEATGKPITGKDESGFPLGGPTFSNEWWIAKQNKQEETLSEEYHYEYVSRIGSYKYGNKEFLTDLADAGILPEAESGPSIAGWSVVQVTATFGGGEDPFTGPDLIYAVHAKRGEVVLLSGVVIDSDDEVRSGYAENWNYKFVNKIDFVKDTDTTNVTNSGNWKSVRRYLVDFDGVLEAGDFSESAYQFQGIYTNAEKLTKVRTGDPENPQVAIFQCGPSKLDKISGSGYYYYAEEFEEREVIEGMFSTAAGKVFADISEQFPEAAEDVF
jgi:hypothetical protein